MLQQNLLDLQRSDIDAARLDHPLQPAAESDPPVCLDRPEIAGQEITVPVESLGIEFWCPKIPWRDVAANTEFADFARGQGPPN